MEIKEPNPQTTIHPKATQNPPRSWANLLIGRPLPTADAPHQTIGKFVGLAVFASDALSSTAYASQEILVILAAVGTAAFGYAIPISISIVLLMGIVVLSYEQTIHAYPNGGGAYIVARDNLGELPAQTAGASLLTDYILTVAVSISSGVAQIISAFPGLYPYRVHIAMVMILLVMLINLRGVRESGMTFAIPSYMFLVAMIFTVGVGVVRYLSGTLGIVVDPPTMHASTTTVQILTPFLLLHAFSNGTSAMTGIEAIANGITAFKEPRSRNAGIVLLWMAAILASLFIGITFLAVHTGSIPSEQETVVSQIARTVYGGEGVLYLITVALTSVILFMAANTAFAGFPRLAAILAQDGFIPRQFTYRGSRLVYSRGIIALALAAAVLVIIFDASVTRMIPLYAIGVFLSFTLSQLGMARRWWKSGQLKSGEQRSEASSMLRHDPKWSIKMVANGFGALCTAVVTLVFTITKFPEGAWIVILIIPVLVFVFTMIHRHYKNLATRLSLEKYYSRPRVSHQRVVIPISGVHQGTLAGLTYAKSLSDDVTAIYISLDPEETRKIQAKWDLYGEGIRLVILESPYRLLIEPIMEYIEALSSIRRPNEVITVVVPQFISHNFWTNILHSQTAFILRMGLLLRPGVIIIEVPYHVD